MVLVQPLVENGAWARANHWRRKPMEPKEVVLVQPLSAFVANGAGARANHLRRPPQHLVSPGPGGLATRASGPCLTRAKGLATRVLSLSVRVCS